MWLPDKRRLARPLHVSIANAYADAIASGTLCEGTRLATHRQLAKALEVSIHTVGKAYDELRRRRLVTGEVGRGTYVLTQAQMLGTPWLTTRRDSRFIDLSLSRPVSGDIHVRKMHEALGDLANGLDYRAYLACRPNTGLDEHREAAVAWLARCGLESSPRNVVITNGASHAIAVALTTVARPGDVVATEAIGHHGIISLAKFLGLPLLGLGCDKSGILPAAFETACRESAVRVLFTVPALAGPTVTLMPVTRRRKLAEIARRYDVAIIEDDAWGPLAPNRPPPLTSFAPRHGYYVTTFSKCLMPGLRTGYLVVPEGMVAPIISRLIPIGWMATPLIAEIASRWVRDGTALDLLEWQRAALERRHRIATEILAGQRYAAHPQALHLWLSLPPNWRAAELTEHAKLAGLAIASCQAFASETKYLRNAVRVAIAAPRSEGDLARGLTTLTALLARDPEPLPLAI